MADWKTINGTAVDLDDPNNPVTGTGNWADYRKPGKKQKAVAKALEEHNKKEAAENQETKPIQKSTKNNPGALKNTNIKVLTDEEIAKITSDPERQKNIKTAQKYNNVFKKEIYSMPEMAIRELGIPEDAIIKITQPKDITLGTMEHIISHHGESEMLKYIDLIEKTITEPQYVQEEHSGAFSLGVDWHKDKKGNQVIIKAIIYKEKDKDYYVMVVYPKTIKNTKKE